MADRADGYIIINTKISTDGMKAGTAEIEAACRRAANSVKGIGDKAAEAADKAFNAFVKQNQIYAEQAQKVNDLKTKLEELGKTQVESSDFQQLNSDIDSVSKKLDAIDAKKEKFIALGGSEEDRTFKNLEYDGEILAAEYDRLISKKNEMLSSGTAYTTPDTSGLTAQIEKEEAKLSGIGTKVQEAYNRLGSTVSKYTAETAKADKETRKFEKTSDSLKKTSGSLEKSIGKGFKTFLRYGLGIRSLFAMFNKIRRAIGEGLKNIVQVDPSANESISVITSSLGMLKNALAAAFVPIIKVVAPYIKIFVQKLVDAINAVGMFFAVLSGKNTYTKAIAYQDDYAASLNKTSKEAKKAARNLSGLDEISNWQSETNGMAENSATTADMMFETVKISNEFIEKVSKIKKKFEELTPVILGVVGVLGLLKLTKFIGDITSATSELGILGGALEAFAGIALLGLVVKMVVDDVKAIISGDLEYGSSESLIRTIISGVLAGVLFSLVFGATPLVSVPIAITLVAAIKWSFTEDAESFWDKVRNFFTPSEPLYGTEDIELVDYPTLEEEGGNVVAYIIDTIDTNAENNKREFEKIGRDMSGGISNGFTDTSIWGKIKQVMTHFPEWIRGEYEIHSPSKVFEKIGKYVAQGFVNGFNGFENSVRDIFVSVKDVIKKPINGIIGYINSMIEGIANGINKVIGFLNGLSIELPEWLPGVGGKKIDFKIPTVTATKIPLLATGAVIPPNAPFMAVLGDQRNGNNIEAPENLIRRIVREESGNGDGNITFIAELDGDVIFKKVIKRGQAQKRSNGKNPFVLA